MSFPRYAAYKDAGVPWLGQVPEHWEVLPLKRIFETVGDRPSERTFAVALENIEGQTGRLIEGEGEFEGDGVAFEKGDILYGKLRPYLAKTWLASRSGEAVGDFHVIRALAEVEPAFFRDFLLTPSVVSVLNGSTYGAKMPRVSWDFMGMMAVVRPPLEEQRDICAFVERETLKIDELVSEQETLLKQLEEKRAATISHVVTKGLDPSVPMKDSGVEWLGRVPAHWDVKPLKQLGQLRIGLTYAPEDVVSEGEGKLVLRSSNVQNGKIDFTDNVFVSCDVNEQSIVRSGDILICSRNGSRHLIGKNALIGPDEDGMAFGAFMTIFRSSMSDFVYFVLNSNMFRQQSSLFLTSTINQLTVGTLGSMRIPVPAQDERSLIAAYLQQALAKLDPLTTEARKNIALLRERRAALISAAVTGRIDVRGTATRPAKVEQVTA